MCTLSLPLFTCALSIGVTGVCDSVQSFVLRVYSLYNGVSVT